MKNQSWTRRLTVAAFELIASVAQAAPVYTFTDLGTLGGNSSVAYGINDSGQVAGSSDTPPPGSHAALWNGTTITDLGTLGGRTSIAGPPPSTIRAKW